MPQNPREQERRLTLTALLTGSLVGLGIAGWLLHAHRTELWAVMICLPIWLIWLYRQIIWPDRFPPTVTRAPRSNMPEPPASEKPNYEEEPHYEFEVTSPFQAGQQMSGWLTVSLADAAQVEANLRWLMLRRGKQAERVEVTLTRVDEWRPTQARFLLTLDVPRYLTGQDWKLHIGTQDFLLPPLRPAPLRPLLEPPLTPEQAARVLLIGQEGTTLRRMYGLPASEYSYVSQQDVTPAERRAAFLITDTELATLAVAQQWSNQQIDTSVRWEGGPFLLRLPDDQFRVVAWAERGHIQDVGTTPDLHEATRLLLREHFGWLPEGESTTATN